MDGMEWVIVLAGVGVGAVAGWGLSLWSRPTHSPVDATQIALQMLETNAELMDKMLERGLTAVVGSMERATYGLAVEEEVAGTAQTPAVVSPDAPVWANWPVDGVVTEGTDAAYPDIVGWDRAERAASVPHLPNFPDMTGEELA